jgi:hypothetical protein
MYRTIESSFWSDPKVRSLSPQAKLLFLYLITNDRSHVSGIYYLPKASISHETGYPINTLSKVVQELIASKTIAVDEERDVFWVKKMFRYQGRGKKNNASATKQLASLHNSPLIKEFCKLYPAVRAPKNDTLSDTLSEVGRDSSQEQEQEQEQKKDKELDSCPETGEPSAVPQPSLMEFPTDGTPKQWHLTQSLADELAEAFPSLDILAEAREAKLWILGDPGRKKTARGMRKFFTGWVSRSQNSGKGRTAVTTAKSQDFSF